MEQMDSGNVRRSLSARFSDRRCLNLLHIQQINLKLTCLNLLATVKHPKKLKILCFRLTQVKCVLVTLKTKLFYSQ